MRLARFRSLSVAGLILVLAIGVGTTLGCSTAEAAAPDSGRLAISGSTVRWELGEVFPGEEIVMPGLVHYVVVSDTAWDLQIDASVRAVSMDSAAGNQGAGRRLTEMPARHQVAALHGGGVDRGTGEHGGYLVSGQASSRVEARLVGEQDHERLTEAPTPAEGRLLSVEIALTPSWDDPPGAQYEAVVHATVSQGDTVLSAYASPGAVASGYSGPITFWYYLADPAAVDDETPVTVSILREDRDEVGRAESQPDAPGWHAIVWEVPAEAALTAGDYRFRITVGGVLLGAGVIRVGGEGAISAATTSSGEASTEASGPLAWADQSAMFAPGAARSLNDGPLALPEARLSIASAPIRPGQPTEWTITVINAHPNSLVGTEVDLCLPPGWIWLAADVPSMSLGGEASHCRRHLLGTVKGKSEARLSVSLTAWALDVTKRLSIGPERAYVLLTATDVASGERFTLDAQYVAAEPAADAFFSRRAEATGRVFVDVNGNGQYEEGEPLLSGARVYIDGVPIAVSNRSGGYRAVLPEGAGLIWAASPRGDSVPIRTGLFRLIPLDTLQIDLPITPHPEGSRSHTEITLSTVGAAAFEPSGPRVATGWRLNLDGDWGAIDAAMDVGPGLPEPLISAGLLPRPLPTSHTQVSGAGQWGPMNWEALVHRGVPQNIRSGQLRPSKPVSEAFHLAVRAELSPTDASPSSRQPRTMPRLGLPPVRPALPNAASGASNLVAPLLAPLVAPFLPPVTLSGGAEVGFAQGDIWSCTLWGGEWAVASPHASLSGKFATAAHKRLTTGKWQLDRAESSTWALTTSVDVDGGHRWPLLFETSYGVKRDLSPSCGLSPHDGRRWRLMATAPIAGLRAGVIDAIEVSGGVWPGSGGTTGSPAYNAEEKRYEIAIASRPFQLPPVGPLGAGEVTVSVTAAVQWASGADAGAGTSTGDIAGSDAAMEQGAETSSGTGTGASAGTGLEKDASVGTATATDTDTGAGSLLVPALRVVGRIGRTHQLQLELGPESLAHPVAGKPELSATRRALTWRIYAGAFRPWLRVEESGLSPTTRTGEAGVQITATLGEPSSLGRTTLTTRLSRTLSKTSFQDQVSLGVNRRAWKGSVQWSSRTPIEELTPDRITWGVSLGYEPAEAAGSAGSAERVREEEEGGEGEAEGDGTHCLCRNWSLESVTFGLNAKILSHAVSSQQEARIKGRWPYGRFLLGWGWQMDDDAGERKSYEVTLVAVRAERGALSAGIEFRRRIGQEASTASHVQTTLEIARRINPSLALIATASQTATFSSQEAGFSGAGTLADAPFAAEPQVTEPLAAAPLADESHVTEPLAVAPLADESYVTEPLAASPFTPASKDPLSDVPGPVLRRSIGFEWSPPIFGGSSLRFEWEWVGDHDPSLWVRFHLPDLW